MLTDVITYFHTPAFPVSRSKEMLIENKTLGQQAPPPAYSDISFEVADHPPPPHVAQTMNEVQWKSKLKKLERKVRKYNWTKRGDEAEILESMRELAASHIDPAVQTYWTRRADEFERAPDADKKALLADIGRAVGLLAAAPFLLTGAILVGTGTILKASGSYLAKAQDIFVK